MGDPRHLLGRAAEEAAARLLERSGLRIVARNVKLRHGEIDLVCRDRDVWVFVEVKCRQERWDDGPAAAVSWWKRRRLIRLAQHYLKRMRVAEAHCRFDVVAVTPRGDGRFEIRHRSEEHTSELQSRLHLVCRLLLEKKNKAVTY